MLTARAPVRRLAAALALVTLVTSCGDTPPPAPPGAEFLVAAGDSTYWVRAGGGGLRLRASPILLARFDGRFHEVYVTDDDRSYDEAVFVGQRVWRRDLLRGDSVLVFEDTIVPQVARRWAAEHPHARLLEPAEAESDDPLAAATAEVSVVSVHGPYLSFEYHVDVEAEESRPWHTTRRGVVDLRSGRQVTVADLFGRVAERRAVAAARRQYRETVDSLLMSGDERAERIAGTIRRFDFDASSFTIEGDAAVPAVKFFVPGTGEGAVGDVAIPVSPVPMPLAPWWTDLRRTLPDASPELPAARWEHRRYVVTAEDAGVADDRARLVVEDARGRTWVVGTVQAPVHHILWLDSPAMDSLTRRGLSRAFNEAVFYDDMTRTAAFTPGVAPRRATARRPAAARFRA